jgi:hypothetical protein
MANAKDAGGPKVPKTGKPHLEQNAIIDKLVPDPSQPQSFAVLSGLLGKSPQPGYWRLYLTAALDEYAELSEDDIIHSESLSATQSALGRTVVWVRSGASVQHIRLTSRQTQAEFLQGSISSRHVASAANLLAALRSGVNPQRLRYNTIHACPSDCCSGDVPVSCPTHWGCGFTRADCGWSDDICDP